MFDYFNLDLSPMNDTSFRKRPLTFNISAGIENTLAAFQKKTCPKIRHQKSLARGSLALRRTNGKRRKSLWRNMNFAIAVLEYDVKAVDCNCNRPTYSANMSECKHIAQQLFGSNSDLLYSRNQTLDLPNLLRNVFCETLLACGDIVPLSSKIRSAASII